MRDPARSSDQPTYLLVIWRQKWLIVATVLGFALVTGVVSKTLTKIYSTTATLIVAQPENSQTFDAVQAAQVIARTYGDLLDSPTIAQLVADRVGGGLTRSEVEQAVTIEPVPETQLLTVTAEDSDPLRAKRIADAYALVFIAYSRRNLSRITKAEVSLADPATLPTSPARPKPTLYVLIASLLGLAVGLVLAFLRERLNARLRSFDEVEAAFPEVPILARVPRRGKSETSSPAFIEAFRVLRTNLQFATPDGMPRTLAITSGGEGEGKTTTVGHLCLVMASTGSKVLAVDGDVHKPTLQRFFLPERRVPFRPGLSEYLAGGVPLSKIVQPTADPAISLAPSGPKVPSLSGLLESDRGQTLIADLADRADITIVDTPPLGFGADAATVAGRVDGVVLVINLDVATTRSVRHAIRQLEAVRAQLLGFVLNQDRSIEPVAYGYLDDRGEQHGDTSEPSLRSR